LHTRPVLPYILFCLCSAIHKWVWTTEYGGRQLCMEKEARDMDWHMSHPTTTWADMALESTLQIHARAMRLKESPKKKVEAKTTHVKNSNPETQGKKTRRRTQHQTHGTGSTGSKCSLVFSTFSGLPRLDDVSLWLMSSRAKHQPQSETCGRLAFTPIKNNYRVPHSANRVKWGHVDEILFVRRTT
jgi:hypothetical protein